MKTDQISSLKKPNLIKSLDKLHDIYLVSSLMLVGLLLRLPSLKLGLWRDEAFTYFDALPVNLEEVFRRVTLIEATPPGFFLLMHQWMQWFGTGEIPFKLPALIFGLLLIPATYVLGQVVGSRKIGVVAAAIATFAPEAIYYSQEARPYTLAALLCCLTVFFYCKALTSRSQAWYLVGFVLCAELLFYVQYTGFFLVASLAIITLYLRWSRAVNIRLRQFAIAFGVIVLLFMPWLPSFLVQLNSGIPWGVKQFWWTRDLKFLENIVYTIPLPTEGKIQPLYEFLRRMIAWLVLLVLGVGATQLFFKTNQSSRRWNTLLNPSTATLGMCFVLYAVMLAVLSFGGRYMFPGTPIAWVLYSSWLIALLQHVQHQWNGHHSRFGQWIAVVLFIAILVLPNTNYALDLGRDNKSGIRALAADIKGKYQQKTLYLISPDHLASTFGYYFAQHPVQFYGFARWEKPELAIIQGYVELWNSQTLISETEQRLREKAQEGYQQLAVISNAPKDKGFGQFFSRSEQLLSKLKQTYPLLGEKQYPGKVEPVIFYLFSLSSQK